MKILRVISSMNPKHGGPCQGIRNIIPILINKGFVNEVVCLDNPNSSYLTKDPFVIYTLGFSKTSLSYSSELIPWLKKNIQNYDIVIVHGLWQYHTYSVRKVIATLKKNNLNNIPKVFIMPHGMLDPWFQKHKSRRLKSIRNSIYWHLIEKKVINDADGLLFTCQVELELAKTTFYGYNPKKTINVGYGIAPPPIYTKEMKETFAKQYPLSKTKPYLLFLSRIHPKKGLDLLLDAYKQILESNKKYTMPLPELVIAGPGIDTTYGKDLIQKVNKNTVLKEHVHFIGMVSGDSKWSALYGCEAFVLPSHQENFGIAVVEALACGKPVLISNQVNIWKEIASVGAGIVDKDTVQGTFQSLEKFLSMSKADSNKMKIQTVFAYKQFFDIIKTAKNLLEAINNSPLRIEWKYC